MGPRAKLLYGLLQTLPGFRGNRGHFTYAALAALTKLGPNTLKRAMRQLDSAGWLGQEPRNRLKPVHFTLGTPEHRSIQASAAKITRRLKRADPRGEAIMHEYLSLLIASKDFAKNVRPGFLENWNTDELLELDRYYPAKKLAFEFNGEQHRRASGKYTQAMVDSQFKRDVIKAGLCKLEDVHLVIVTPEDLSLKGMIRKIGTSTPLRDLSGLERLVDLLEEESIRYLATVRTGS